MWLSTTECELLVLVLSRITDERHETVDIIAMFGIQ